MARKPSRGRQRIPMEKMQNQSRLQVTFSKRRSGIMKKSNELSTLTGSEMAFIIFSPANKASSFGNPSVETVLNRYQNKIPNPPANNNTFTEMLHQIVQEEKLKKLHAKIDLLKQEMEDERKLKEIVDRISEIEEKNNNLCLEASDENLNMEQLEKLKEAFQELNLMAENKMKKLDIQEIQKIQKEPSFQFQNVYEHPHHDAPNIKNASGYMHPFANYGVGRNVFGSSQVYAGPSTFGGGFHFIPGEASSSINNGVQMNVPMEAPASVGSFVVQRHYDPNIQGYGPPF